ncbi:class II fructose-bisphosphate aldolase [Moorellaceae bacterium AZ2]
MPLVTTKAIMDRALAGGYAVGAFNVCNLEMTQGVMEAAVSERSPVIIQVWAGILQQGMKARTLAAIVKSEAEACEVPVSLHLDHGTSLEDIKEAIDAGFSSVMIDASMLTLRENIKVTRQVVRMAREAGVSTEAEIGHVGGGKEGIGNQWLTSPNEAEIFVRETEVDFLAVAIGTAHGFYECEPCLDFERLTAIKKKVQIPLVLHGASFTPPEQLARAIGLGITKVNVATEINIAMIKGIKMALADEPQIIWPDIVLRRGRAEVAQEVKGKLRLFGSTGKAWMG